jgi:hypothetical protein
MKLAVHAVVFVLACSGGGGKTGMSSSPDASNGMGMSDNGELAIASLTPTSQTMTGGRPTATETDTITFIAIVTDTNGLDDIAGGELSDDSGATYAAFSAGTNKSTYTAALSWKAMTSIHAADFGNAGGKRTFVAKFFDNKGNKVMAQVSIDLACRFDVGLLEASCGGACTNVDIDPHNCGSCGNELGLSPHGHQYSCVHGMRGTTVDGGTCTTGSDGQLPCADDCASTCAQVIVYATGNCSDPGTVIPCNANRSNAPSTCYCND